MVVASLAGMGGVPLSEMKKQLFGSTKKNTVTEE